jgi:isopenicillin-N epimerase
MNSASVPLDAARHRYPALLYRNRTLSATMGDVAPVERSGRGRKTGARRRMAGSGASMTHTDVGKNMGVTTRVAPVAGTQFLLRPDVAFLNHGSFGACPRPVFETYQKWQRELEAEPVDFLAREIDGRLAEARAGLGAYVGAPADDLVFVPNATTGMNILARAIRLQPGDEILGTDHEYGAVERTWRYLCGAQGATYRRASVPLPVSDPATVVDQIFAAATERTRAVVVSHITSPTAVRFPVERIVRRAHERGMLAIVDGAHAPGQVDLNLEALGADFYTGNCHKWLCAPKGAGFLYVRPEHHAALQPLVVSWGYDPGQPSAQPLQDYFEWVGTADPAAYLSVPAAIEFQREHNWPAVRAACHALAGEARERIGALTRLPQIYPDSTDWWVQMCAAPIPLRDGETREALHDRLRDEFSIQVPITDWGGQRFVRVSIQAYNSPDDVDRLLAALAKAL